MKRKTTRWIKYVRPKRLFFSTDVYSIRSQKTRSITFLSPRTAITPPATVNIYWRYSEWTYWSTEDQGECSTDETPGCCMTYQVNHLYRRPGAYRTHTLTRSLTPATTDHKRTGRTTDSPTELGSLFTSRNGFSATDCLRPHDHSCTPYLLGPATQNAVCRSWLRSLSAAECYILSRLF